MSEDERDIDVESDEDDDSDPRPSSFGRSSSQYFSQADKRAHHNALERKRRDHIKDSFTDLRDAVPELQGEKVASRAQILKKAAEYITTMRKKNNSHAQDIDSLKRQNELLEAQVKLLRKMRSRRRGASVPGNVNSSDDGESDFDADGDTPDEFADSHSPNKKLKASRD